MEWFDLRNMLLVARAVTDAAAARTESRGAHQREDFPETQSDWRLNHEVRMAGDHLQLTRVPAGVKADA